MAERCEIDDNVTEIQGEWLLVGRRVVRDENAELIERLVQSHLEKIDSDETGWRTLFRDPCDGRLWERTFPSGESHGGGPPLLRLIAPADARKVFPLAF
jgi:hypothetical protein